MNTGVRAYFNQWVMNFSVDKSWHFGIICLVFGVFNEDIRPWKL
jgi:hypothetical protein